MKSVTKKMPTNINKKIREMKLDSVNNDDLFSNRFHFTNFFINFQKANENFSCFAD